MGSAALAAALPAEFPAWDKEILKRKRKKERKEKEKKRGGGGGEALR